MYCSKCKKLVINKFCGYCGTKAIEGTFLCPHFPCNEENYVNDKFCCGCGKPIQEEAKDFIAEMLENAKEGGGDGIKDKGKGDS